MKAKTKGKSKKEEDGFEKLLLDMENYEHGNEGANREVRRGASRMRKRAGNERSGVSSTATAQLAIFADPIIAKNTSACDFTINDLMNADQPTDVYLVLSPAEIGRMKALIRIILNQMLTRLTAHMSHEEDHKHYKHRMLLMLDEFPQLGKLDIFESSLAFMAGYGLKAFLITQDIAQLQAAYSREESIISNCHVRIAYAPNKIETARVLSEMTGKTTVVQRKRSVSKNLDRATTSISENVSEVARPLMTPDECMLIPGIEVDADQKAIGPGKMLIFTAGKSTIYGQQYLYFFDDELKARSKLKPSGNVRAKAPVAQNENQNKTAKPQSPPAETQKPEAQAGQSDGPASSLPQAEDNALLSRFLQAAHGPNTQAQS